MLYILDAYNIIHYIGTDSFPEEDAPGAFVGFLLRHRLFSSGKNKAIVVFDGFPKAKEAEHRNIKVVFSRDISADERIERLLKRNEKAVVVSNDRQVLNSARMAGAVAVKVEAFLRMGKDARLDKSDGAEKKVSPADIKEINEELERLWLRKEF